jgi:carbon-monoxide dehydrogenase medium subunit
MKPAPFQYHAPRTVDETLDLLAKFAPDDGRVLAGGQSLVPTMAFRLSRPKHLIDINGVKDLDTIKVRDGRLCIGAGVRHAAFHSLVEDGPLGRLLSRVVRDIAHFPIRVRGTFCGSIANADPASEWCAVAAALDAEMVAESRRGGRRIVPAKDFFKGVMTTALWDDELLREVRLPILAADAHVGFAEFSRRAGDFAIAMAVSSYRLQGGAMTDVHVALGGVEAAPRRIPDAERILSGQSPSAGVFQTVAQAARKAIDPLDDENISADYRRSIVPAMICRALEKAAP